MLRKIYMRVAGRKICMRVAGRGSKVSLLSFL